MIRVLIVDDERPARAKLRRLLAEATDFEIVGEAQDGDQAVTLVRDLAPDVVFLDVQMPKGGGFEVVAAVGVERMPVVVFVTAYDEHALHAFEVHALDYLLKPFAPERFHHVLDRVRAQLQQHSRDDLVERLGELLAGASDAQRYYSRIRVRFADERETMIPVDRIDVVRAERNYLRFFTAKGEFVRRGRIGEMAEHLDPRRFLRVNRSEIVRLDAVVEILPWFHGDRRIRLSNGMKLSWSRRYRARTGDAF